MSLVAENSGRGARIANREARRRQLIEATIASIAELGFADTTLSTVTTRAGLSHGTINFHFKSKEFLFVETLTYLQPLPQSKSARAAPHPRASRQSPASRALVRTYPQLAPGANRLSEPG